MNSFSIALSPRAFRLAPFVRLSIVLHIAAIFMLAITPLAWPWLLAALATNHLCLTLVGLWPRSHWLGPNLTRLPPAATARGEIALTIDDGPDPEVTPKVLELLDRLNVKATFFCIGERAARHPDLCRDIVARGHAVENHSQHHRLHFSLMGRARIRREIVGGQDILQRITGRAPQFFRAPAGLRNPLLDPVLQQCGLRLVSWSRRGFDTRSGDANLVFKRLIRNLKAGSILLLHDGHSARTESGVPVLLDVLPMLIDRAHRAGLHFVTLAQACQEPALEQEHSSSPKPSCMPPSSNA